MVGGSGFLGVFGGFFGREDILDRKSRRQRKELECSCSSKSQEKGVVWLGEGSLVWFAGWWRRVAGVGGWLWPVVGLAAVAGGGRRACGELRVNCKR